MIDQKVIKDKALDGFIEFMEGLDLDKKDDGEKVEMEISAEIEGEPKEKGNS